MKLKTTEIPAIIDEAKSAGCENAEQINGYLAGEVSRLRGILEAEMRENEKLQHGATLYDFEAFAVAQHRRLIEALHFP